MGYDGIHYGISGSGAGELTTPRVLHLVHTPGPGGTEQVALNLLEWIPRTAAVQALAAPEGHLEQEAANRGIEFYHIPYTAVRRSLSPIDLGSAIALVPSLMRRTKKVIARFSPDIIHAHSAKSVIMTSFSVGKVRSWKLVWHLHDYVPLGMLRSALIRLALAAADEVIAVSHAVAQDVCGRHQVRIIPNAIVFQDIPESKPSGCLRDRAGIPSNAEVLGYAGRLDREKGIAVLLECVQSALSILPDIHLLVAGDSPFKPGEMRKHWEERAFRLGIHEHVHFLGHLAALDDYFRSIDIFVLPAYREPFGLVLLEALARGIPVVACDAGGPSEILARLRGSSLVPVGDPHALAQECVRLLRDPNLRLLARQEGPELVAKSYSPSVQVQAVTSLYEEVLRS